MSQSALLWLFNILLIGGIFYWSGSDSSIRLYDRHHARVEAVVFSVADTETASAFYEEVLELPLSASSSGRFTLPGGLTLQLLQREASSSPSTGAPAGVSEIRVSVKNGFERFHRDVSMRAKKAGKESLAGPITGDSQKREFMLQDLDGNLLLFSNRKH